MNVTISHYDGDTGRLDIYRRTDMNPVLASFKCADVYESLAIEKAFEKMYNDGVTAGRNQFFVKMNQALSDC